MYGQRNILFYILFQTSIYVFFTLAFSAFSFLVFSKLCLIVSLSELRKMFSFYLVRVSHTKDAYKKLEALENKEAVVRLFIAIQSRDKNNQTLINFYRTGYIIMVKIKLKGAENGIYT